LPPEKVRNSGLEVRITVILGLDPSSDPVTTLEELVTTPRESTHTERG